MKVLAETSKELRICISREVGDNRIEVWIDSEDGFGEAYRTLLRLCDRARIEPIRSSLRRFWITEGGKEVITGRIADNSHRIALALVNAYPKCVQEADVVKLTGIPQMTVNDQLRGKVKSTAGYFAKCNGGYQLSETGLHWFINEILSGLPT